MRRWLTLLALTACGVGPVRVDVPSGSHQSMVVAVDDGGDLSVHAIELGADRQPVLQTLLPSYIGSYEVRLTAFFYDQPLADLALLEGEVLPATIDPKRKIPSATSTMTVSIHGESVGQWESAEQLSPDVEAFRIPGVQVDECIGQGGCFDEDSFFCRVPCPEVAPPDPPLRAQIPAPSCATGWSTVEVKPGVSACTPWPNGTPECENSDAIFPGESACHALGPGCPAGPWPTQLPGGPKIYVRDGAAGGDGSSEGSPLGSIQAGISAASGGDVVVIAEGTYDEAVGLTKSVTLFGACPERTIIDGGAAAAVVVSTMDTATISNLTLTGATGVSFNESSSLILSDATIVGTTGRGLNMTRPARAELHDVLIRDTGGIAIWTEGLGPGRARATLTAQRLHIVDSHGGLTSKYSDLTVDDSMVRRSVPGTTRDLGRGATIGEGVLGAFHRTAFEDNLDVGVFISRSTVDLDQVVVRGTKSHPADARFGHGVEIQNGAIVNVRRSWIDTNQAQNLYLPSEDTEILFEDSIISRSRRSDANLGGAHALITGGSPVFKRVAFTDSAFTSISIEDASGEVRLEDVTVLDADGAAIYVKGVTSRLDAERVRIEGSTGLGIRIVGGRAKLSDVDIFNAGTGDCFPCAGLCVREGASVLGATRIAIAETHGGGILATSQATRLTATQVAIRDSRPWAPCVDETPPVLIGRGTGLLALEGGQITVDHFSISHSVESGAQIADLSPEAEGTSLDLSYGVISDNAIGATISLADFDARRIATSVAYSRNTINLSRDE